MNHLQRQSRLRDHLCAYFSNHPQRHFGMILRLPDKAGQNLYFPIVQECEKGVHRWIEIPANGQSADKLREPAPFIRLKAKGQ